MSKILGSKIKTQLLPFIKSNLGKISQREIARRLKIGKTTVNTWSKELGYAVPKHTFNENFFNSFTENSAYILGFIFADGNVAWNVKKSYWTLTITSAAKDRDNLEKIRGILQSTKPLLYSPQTNSYRLTITNRKLCQKLIEMGVVPRKSLIVRFPNIPKKHLQDFIRGVVDGDGSVRYQDRKRSPYFDITIFSGSKQFCIGLVSAIEKNFQITANVRKHAKNVYVVGYTCSRGERLAQKLYSNATIFLQRKHSAYEILQERRLTHV